jgi:hypothetical protein
LDPGEGVAEEITKPRNSDRASPMKICAGGPLCTRTLRSPPSARDLLFRSAEAQLADHQASLRRLAQLRLDAS